MMTRSTRFNLALAGAIVAVSAAVTYAKFRGWVGSDIPMRVIMAMIGLQMAFYGNMAPKWAATAGPRKRAVQRLAGWLFVLTGLFSAAVWAFAPLRIAAEVSMVPTAAALVAVLGYCAWTRRAAARAG